MKILTWCREVSSVHIALLGTFFVIVAGSSATGIIQLSQMSSRGNTALALFGAAVVAVGAILRIAERNEVL